MTARVLVVEDAEAIRTAVVAGLGEAGFGATGRPDGRGLEDDLATFRPDLVVLDVMLPGRDGFALLDVVRRHSDAGVVMLTARDAVDDRLRGLHGGADDYVVKPYSAAHLEARIRAVLRRAEAIGGVEGGGELVVGSLVVVPGRREATIDGRKLDLTRLEFDLLMHLARRSPEVVTRRELLAEVWQQPYGGADKTVDVHLSWLRRKLGETGSEPRYLHTVRGVGVRLTAPAGG
jgi:two-component system, OmpR family, response regulator